MQVNKLLPIFVLLSTMVGCMPKKLTQIPKESSSYPYLLYVPQEYASQEKVPLVLFLHGAGERGDDLEKVKVHGPPKLVEQGQTFPFILVSPQAPEEERWQVAPLEALLNEIEQKYRIDEQRIYVTGLSMGGEGTWKLGMAFPNRFAALAPICGWGDETNVAVLKDVPIWVFHGAKDNVIPLESSQKLVDALRNAGSTVQFTIYPKATHDSWTATYNNPAFFDWLLNQHK